MLGNVIQIKSRTAICVNVSLKIKKIHLCKNDCVWNPSIRFCKTDEYLKSIIIDSVLTCDKVIEKVTKSYNNPTKATPIFFNDKKTNCKMDKFYILLFLLPDKTWMKTKTDIIILP